MAKKGDVSIDTMCTNGNSDDYYVIIAYCYVYIA